MLIAAALPAACTWVKETPGGDKVRVAYDGNVSGCRDAGAITVSVADKVAFYHRPDLKVRDELETLARTQAAGRAANINNAENAAFFINVSREPWGSEQDAPPRFASRFTAHFASS